MAPVIVKYMKKDLDVMKPRYSKQILPVPWPSLYRGSTGELAVMLGVVRGNPLNDSPAGQYKTFYSC